MLPYLKILCILYPNKNGVCCAKYEYMSNKEKAEDIPAFDNTFGYTRWLAHMSRVRLERRLAHPQAVMLHVWKMHYAHKQ